MQDWVQTSSNIVDDDRAMLLSAEVFKKFEVIHGALINPSVSPSIPPEAAAYRDEVIQWRKLRSDAANCYLPFFCSSAGPPSPNPAFSSESR